MLMNLYDRENEVIALHQHIASGSCHQAANLLWSLLFTIKPTKLPRSAAQARSKARHRGISTKDTEI
jgi:hypothetical protein